MNCVVNGITVERNKYYLDSMTLIFDGVPTSKQALIAAKKYAMGCAVKPDFNNKSLEIHLIPSGRQCKVQFYPCVKNAVGPMHR